MATFSYARIILLAFISLYISLTRAECTRVIISADPAYPPLHWYDGKTLQGASIEIAKRVLDDLKIPYEVHYAGPFPRVLALAEHGEIDLVATLKKTPEREKFLLYPETTALVNPVAVFVASKNSKFVFKDRRDLIGLTGGITRGNVFGEDFDVFLKQQLKIEEANTLEQNFSKLGLGRIDYLVTGFYAGMAHIIKSGSEKKYHALSPYVTNAPNYIALTRNGNCSEKLGLIDAQLALLKQNGVVDEITKKSFARWKAYPVAVHK